MKVGKNKNLFSCVYDDTLWVLLLTCLMELCYVVYGATGIIPVITVEASVVLARGIIVNFCVVLLTVLSLGIVVIFKKDKDIRTELLHDIFELFGLGVTLLVLAVCFDSFWNTWFLQLLQLN